MEVPLFTVLKWIGLGVVIGIIVTMYYTKQHTIKVTEAEQDYWIPEHIYIVNRRVRIEYELLPNDVMKVTVVKMSENGGIPDDEEVATHNLYRGNNLHVHWDIDTDKESLIDIFNKLRK